MNAVVCNLCHHDLASHSDIAGCLAEDGTEYCTCTETQAQIMRQTAQDGPQTAAQSSGLAEGRRRRDEGAQAAGAAVPGALASDWRAKAERALVLLIGAGQPFDADDLVEIAGMPPVPNMLGATILNASRAKRIQAVGYTQGTRPESHARVQRLWQAKP